MLRLSFALLAALTLRYNIGYAFVSNAEGTKTSLQAVAGTLDEITTPAFNEEKTSFGTFINVDERLAKSTFAIAPKDLVERAKTIMKSTPLLANPSYLADNFEFCPPIVGPLNKGDYIAALSNFNLDEAFDIDSRVYNIHVDPFEYNRVWFFVRPIAVHVGEFAGAKATGKVLHQPPQACSFTFNEQGLVTQLTVGYVMDKRVGNTGGLGAAFGLLYGIGRGLPIPECKPYKPSWQFRLLNFVGKVLNKLKKKDAPDVSKS
jgi:hypothetical protein